MINKTSDLIKLFNIFFLFNIKKFKKFKILNYKLINNALNTNNVINKFIVDF